jgi:hypothetical protein
MTCTARTGPAHANAIVSLWEDVPWSTAPDTCGLRDLDDNVHIRDSDWKYKRISRRRWLRRKDTTLGGTFHEMFPAVAIPA